MTMPPERTIQDLEEVKKAQARGQALQDPETGIYDKFWLSVDQAFRFQMEFRQLNISGFEKIPMETASVDVRTF